ncbi:hypothetical protein [Marinicella sp. W31]|uniref:sulfotransferase-like domain-containing protein n=1 Tax=Marinicella sp. W31 TaxID=3023713 RepID=UPI003757F769
MKIAMWSGPRNISTAMMRSWENRPDTVVVDEPLYGPYLHHTGKQHPGYADVIADQGADWQPIIEQLTAPLAPDYAIYYQKHMSHHLLDEMPLDWVLQLNNVFLIRNPREVLASYVRKNPDVSPADLGFPQQHRLFEFIQAQTGETPLVLDSRDVLANPEKTLEKLCNKLGISFDKAMLSWPTGYRSSDGVWAKHWYNRVIESTGFAPYRPKSIELDAVQQRIVDACEPHYDFLKAHT